jgi:hypothetical protein
LFSGIRMAAVSKFNHDGYALFRGQTRFKERVGLGSFRVAREYLNNLIHNLIVSTWIRSEPTLGLAEVNPNGSLSLRGRF